MRFLLSDVQIKTMITYLTKDLPNHDCMDFEQTGFFPEASDSRGVNEFSHPL